MRQLGFRDRLGGLRVKRLHWPTRALSIGAISVMIPFVAGCGGPATSGPATTATVTAEPTATSVPTSTPKTSSAVSQSSQAPVAAKADKGKAAWLEHVRNRAVSGTVQGQTDDELVASAKKMCDQMQGGELFEEVAYNLVATSLPKTYQTDIQLIFGTGTVHFCPEFLIDSGTGEAATLKRLREVAPSIAHNADSVILDQARTACLSVSRVPSAAATVAEARRAWGHDQGYKFIYISVLNYCSGSINNVIANK